MPVTSVGSLLELNNVVERADANRLIIIDFYANWCGPCKMISPIFEELSMQYNNATFLKVNTDEARDIVARYGISAMPTFIFIKNKQQVEMIRGANQPAIRAALQKHYSSTPANPNAASDAEKKFLEQFVRYTDLKRFYTDEVYKALARSVMPEEQLKEKSKDPEGNVNEVELLKNLLDWFKNDFFTWFDRPTCEKCDLQAKSGGLAGTPTKEEREGGASRVEVFSCDGCNAEMRFPRYNDPAKLLMTRTGRCGEWANCFSLMLSAIGLEARIVLDTTDHVWNEVYLQKQKRWCHADPCENVMDRPLLYTKGWKKQLSYCIAYGNDHVADVTWRYVYDGKMTATRRVEVRQMVLENFLTKLNSRQGDGLSEQRKKELAVRRGCELMEMMVEDLQRIRIGWEKLEDQGGRTTGSEEWRRERGEIGNQTVPSVLGAPIKLSLIDSESKMVEFKYDVNSDQYSDSSATKGLVSMAFEAENVQRCVEKDWKTVYVCRKDGTKNGTVSWQFDLNSIGKGIEKVEVSVAGIKNFEKGRAMAIACLGDTCMRIPPDTGLLSIDSPTSGVLKITATLSGGEGNIAFQQAQIFRNSYKKSPESEPADSFVIKIWTK